MTDTSAEKTEKKGVTTAEALRKYLRRLVIATALLYLLLIGVAYYIYNVAQNTTEGVCAFRNDVQARVDGGKQFLIDNPKGTKEISVDVIKNSIANGERSVKSLSKVKCPPPPQLTIPTPTPEAP